MIRVTLPDGRSVDVNTDDEKVARNTAQDYLDNNPLQQNEAPVTSSSPQPEPEEVGAFEDIARGAGAGAVGIPQGIAELGAAGIDYALDTNTSRTVTESFEDVKDFFGLTPAGTAGKVTESIVNFAGAALPVVGWLGRAASVAQGGAKLAGQTSRLTKAAESFGSSAVGKALLKDRVRQATTSSAAAGVADMFVAPDGTATLSDSFDALPEALNTEPDTGLQGRDEAGRRIRNKLRFGAEGTIISGAVEAAFPVLSGVSRGVSMTPGVSKAAGIISNGFDYLGKKASEIPTIKRMFTSGGEAPKDIYENMTSAESLVDEITDAAAKNLSKFDSSLKKVVKGQKLFGKGKAGINEAYDNLTLFLEGTNKNALDKYGDNVVKAGQGMRDQIDGLTDLIAKQLEDALDRGSIDALTKNKLLLQLTENKTKYLRRIYENVLDPEKVIDQAVRETPAYKSAIVEISNMLRGSDKKAVKTGSLKNIRSKEELESSAKIIVDRELMGNSIDLGLDPSKSIGVISKNIQKGRKAVVGERPLFNVAEGLLKERSRLADRSPSLRLLLGEVTDPKRRYLQTVGDMSRLLSSNYLYDDIAQTYMVNLPKAVDNINQGGRPLVISGEGVTEPQADQLIELGYKSLGTFEADTMFGGKYGQLSGGFVAPEIYASLTLPARNQNGWQEALAVSLQAKGLSQMSKTVLNPLAQVRNFLSGIFMVGANGNVMRNMDFMESMRLTIGKSANLDDSSFREAFEMTGKLGIRDQNLTVNEFRSLLREGSDLKFSGKLASGVEAVADKIPILGKPVKFFQDVYSGTDTFWKVVGLNSEKAKYAAAMKKSGVNPELPGTLSDALIASGVASRSSGLPGALDDVPFLDIMASDIVKSTMPTYSRVPEFIKSIRRVPLIGNFIAFPAEIIRNTTNIANQGFKEMSFKKTDAMIKELGDKKATQFQKEVRAIGAQRLMGYTAMAYTVPRAAQAAAMELTGVTEEDLQAMQKTVADFMRGHVFIPLSKPKNGKMEFVDFSYMNPYDYALAPAREALRIYQEKGELNDNEVANLSLAIWSGFKTFMEPFAGESLVAERIQNALPQEYFGRGGATATGSLIYGRAESQGEKIRKSINHVLGGFNPGLIEQFALERGGEFVAGRATRAIGNIPGRQGQESSVKEEILTGLTGLRRLEIDLPNTLYYRGYEYGSLRSSAIGGFNSIARRNDSTVSEIIDQYNTSNEDLLRAQGAMYQVIEAARQLDMPDSQIRRTLKRDSKLGNRELSAIMRGKFEPIRPSRDVIKAVIEEARVKKQPRIVQKLPIQDLYRIYNELRGSDLATENIIDDTQPAFSPREAPPTVSPEPSPTVSPEPSPTTSGTLPSFLQIPQAAAPVAPAQANVPVSPILVPNPVTRATFGSR